MFCVTVRCSCAKPLLISDRTIILFGLQRGYESKSGQKILWSGLKKGSLRMTGVGRCHALDACLFNTRAFTAAGGFKGNDR